MQAFDTECQKCDQAYTSNSHAGYTAAHTAHFMPRVKQTPPCGFTPHTHTHTRFQQMNILDCQRCCQTACSYTAELLIPHCIQFIECDVFTLQTQHQLLNFFPLSSLKGIYLFSSLNIAVKG